MPDASLRYWILITAISFGGAAIAEEVSPVRANPVIEVRLALVSDFRNVPQGARSGFSGKEDTELAAYGGMALLGDPASATKFVLLSALRVVGVGFDAAEERRRAELVLALERVNLPALIHTELLSRLPERTPNASDDLRLQVLVRSYGFMQGARGWFETLCVVLDADLVLLIGGEERHRSNLVIRPDKQQEDLPPANCASRDRIIENDARLLRQWLADYVEVVGAIAARRLPQIPWR